jgi:hypothetical protein
MVLKFEQQLSSEDAAIIRDIYSKRRFFADLKDYRLFYKDFRNFLKTSSRIHYEYFRETSVLKKLGSFTFPKSSIDAFPKNSMDTGGAFTEYLQYEKEQTFAPLKLGFGENPWSNGFSFYLEEAGEDGDTIFSLSQIYNDWMDEELDYESDEESENLLARGLILDFATYFHNLFPLCQQIYKTLLANKKSLTRYIGKNLLQDFLLLFSLKAPISGFPVIDFSKLPTKKTFSKRTIKPQTNWLKLGHCEHYYYKNKGKAGAKWVKTLNDIELWLNASNKLITIITPMAGQSSSGAIFAEESSEVFDVFAKNDISDWINQIISSTFFADRLYQNFKTRIVLDNI